MAVTIKSDVIIPELFAVAMQGAFKGKEAFSSSVSQRLGLVEINNTFKGDPTYGTFSSSGQFIGNTINIPYFNSLGEFEDDSAPDGTAVTSRKAGTQYKETTTTQHSRLQFEMTAWARNSGVGDPYAEAVRQAQESASRRLDKAIIDAAVATNSTVDGGQPNLVVDAYSSTTPRYADWDLLADAQAAYEDELDDIAAIVIHSKARARVMKLKDADGRPLFVDSMATNGNFSTLMGYPVIVSDRCPVESGSMGTVVSTGTTPPTMTISGTAVKSVNLVVKCTTAGANGTSKVVWSTNGGATFTKTPVVTVQSGTPITITDPNSGESTGLTMYWANAAAATDNVWTCTLTSAKVTTMFVKRGSLVFWYNAQKLSELQSVVVPETDSVKYAIHLYFAAHRYNSLRNSYKPGVVLCKHNL